MSVIMTDFPLHRWQRIATDLEISRLQQAGEREGFSQEDENVRLRRACGPDRRWAG
jgi:hypothetical protein